MREEVKVDEKAAGERRQEPAVKEGRCQQILTESQA